MSDQQKHPDKDNKGQQKKDKKDEMPNPGDTAAPGLPPYPPD